MWESRALSPRLRKRTCSDIGDITRQTQNRLLSNTPVPTRIVRTVSSGSDVHLILLEIPNCNTPSGVYHGFWTHYERLIGACTSSVAMFNLHRLHDWEEDMKWTSRVAVRQRVFLLPRGFTGPSVGYGHRPPLFASDCSVVCSR